MRTLRFEIKNFLADRSIAAAILIVLIAGGYSFHYGSGIVGAQKAIAADVPRYQTEHTKKQLGLNRGDVGNFLYYYQFTTVHFPSTWAPLAIGQRDINPFSIKVRMLTLEGQIYDSEISNPKSQLYGNLDLAFVIVFLIPLLVIAFSHNVVSSDRENGIWDLLRSQPVSPASIIGGRLAIRFCAVVLLALILLVAGAAATGASFDLRFVYALIVVFAYICFWFAAAALVVSLGRSTTFNALSLLGTWIGLTILIPALLNLAVSTALPVSESFEVTLSQREGYHSRWDRPRSETMERFYETYPEYRSLPVPEDRFSWGWYYAAQLMGDIDADRSRSGYVAKLRERDRWTSRAALAIPTINAQLGLSRIARTDLESHLEYLDSVREHHRRVREHFYPLIFRNAKVEEIDWSAVPAQWHDDENRQVGFPYPAAATLGLALILALIARNRILSS